MTQPTFEHRFIDTSRLRLHYVEFEHNSADKTIVFLHGIGVDWRVWQATARRLASGFRLLMPDLRGHGKSGKPESEYRLSDYASDIEFLLGTVNMPNVTLVGSSLGAMVALWVRARPNVVAGRVLIDPPLTQTNRASLDLFGDLLKIKKAQGDPEHTKAGIRAALLCDNSRIGAIYLDYLTDTWMNTATGVLDDALHGWPSDVDAETVAQAIKCPVLAMYGNPDLGSVVRRDDIDRIVDLMPNGRSEYFPEAGHAIHAMRPEEFCSSLRSFVEESP